MYNSFRYHLILILLIGSIIYLISCKKSTTPGLTVYYPEPIAPTFATVLGDVITDGGSDVTSKGICWDIKENPTIASHRTLDGSGTGIYTGNITDLTPKTKYYLRAYASNSEGYGYSDQISFSTPGQFNPAILATTIISYTTSTASVEGNIKDKGGSAITESGICWSTSPNPAISDIHISNSAVYGKYYCSMKQLTANSKYYVRSYAKNSAGTNYGNEVILTTLSESEGTVTDNDGNTYGVIAIGPLKWMDENLKTTTFNNGESIPLVTDNFDWANLKTPAYCWYNNDPANKNIYGALYNLYAVNTSLLCPEGWSVPEHKEIDTLVFYAGGSEIAGGHLKEQGSNHWVTPNTGGTNASGFIALPGGERGFQNNYSFDNIGQLGVWWIGQSSDQNYTQSFDLSYNKSSIDTIPGGSILYHDSRRTDGESVRCFRK